jgi:hypothetical protein
MASFLPACYIPAMTSHRSDLERAIYGEHSLSRLLHDDPIEKLRRELGQGMLASDIVSQMAAGRPRVDLATVQAAAEAHKLVTEMAKPYGGIAEMTRSLFDQQRQMSRWIDEMGGAGELNRIRQLHWAAALIAPSAADIATLMPNVAMHMREIERAKMEALALGTVSGMRETVALKAARGVPDTVRAALEATSLKMSVLAGVGEVSGLRSSAYDDAVRGLMGDWRLRPDLPSSFWRDRRVRERHYRRADVDPGLVAAPPPVAVEIIVDSGLAVGAQCENGAVALFGFGGVSVSIRATDAQIDAYRCVLTFERRLRRFVAEKLAAHAGPKWFKQRVDPGVFQKAKGIREAALKSGEQRAELVNYTELGELKEIVLRSDNWSQVFEPVFVNHLRFEHDMQTLMAIRRPTAHSRIVDSPQILEALLVMKRLDDRMSDDGGWKLAAAADE